MSIRRPDISIENCLSYACPQLQEIRALQQYTDDYLRSKGSLSDSARDLEVNRLIRQAKQQLYTFLACVHVLSKREIGLWLSTIKRRFDCVSQLRTYLGIITLVSELNTSALTNEDVQTVQNFRSLQKFVSEYPQRKDDVFIGFGKIRLLKDVESNFNFTKSILHYTTSNPHGIVSGRLTPLKDVLHEFFQNANDLMIRLRSPSSLPLALQYLRPLAMSDEWLSLHNYFQSRNHPQTNSAWRAWRIWNPNVKHIDIIVRFPVKWCSMPTFEGVFRLEEPDFTKERYRTCLHRQLTESVDVNTVRSGSFRLSLKVVTRNRLQETTDEIYEILDLALKLKQRDQDKALKLIDIVLSSEPVYDHHVRIARAVINHGFVPPHVAAVYQNFFANTYTDRQKDKAVTLQHVLELADMPHISEVKEDVATLVGGVTAKELHKHLEELRRTAFMNPQLIEAELSGIQPYIQLFIDNPWLENYVDKNTWTIAQTIPTKEALKLVLTFRERFFSLIPETSDLRSLFGLFLEFKLLGGSNPRLQAEDIDFLDTLIHKATQLESPIRISLIFEIAQWTLIAVADRTILIKAGAEVSNEFAGSILSITDQDEYTICVSLAEILCKHRAEDTRDLFTWKRMLEALIAPVTATILERTAMSLDTDSWMKWILNIHKLYESRNVVVQPTGLLNPKLHDWTRRLLSRGSQLSKLNALLGGSRPAMKAIYLGHDDPVQMLLLMDTVAGDGFASLGLCKVLLSRVPLEAAEAINKILHIFSFVQNTDLDSQVPAIQKLLAICRKFDENTSHALLLLWWQSPLNTASLKSFPEAQIAFANILPYLKLSGDELQHCIWSAEEFLKSQYEVLQSRMGRLRDVKLALRMQDHTRTTKYLSKLGLKETGLLTIPLHLAEVIEEVNATSYDMFFPLDGLRTLQKLAWGAGSAKLITVRIEIARGLQSPRFCVRLDNDDEPSFDRRPFNKSSHGGSGSSDQMDALTMGRLGKPCRITYSITRLLLLHFEDGFEYIEGVYKLVSNFLSNVDRCVMCHAGFNVTVWRPTTCRQEACVSIASWKRFQISDFDPKVLDLYIQSAMSANNEDQRERLLPGCPVMDSEELFSLVDCIPRTVSLQHSFNTMHTFWQSSNAMSLITYLTSLRVFVTEATGMLKIPALPNAHQFVVCSSCPEVEAMRAKRLRTSPAEDTRVVFHGTSVDRLISVLTDGLKALSYTPLQRNGASFGKGIYCSSEPSFALAYSNCRPTWRNTAFDGAMKVVLGCELAGGGREVADDGQIIVVDDAVQLSLRYIFLFPPKVQAPEARFIVPAMKSAFGLMRANSN